ncbi:hypothetical protein OQA88_11362 [Cercophora sp. LCS_1]
MRSFGHLFMEEFRTNEPLIERVVELYPGVEFDKRNVCLAHSFSDVANIDELLWLVLRTKYPLFDKAGRANYNDRYIQKPYKARVAYEKELKSIKTMTAGVPYQTEVKYRWEPLRQHQKPASPPKIRIKVVGI